VLATVVTYTVLALLLFGADCGARADFSYSSEKINREGRRELANKNALASRLGGIGTELQCFIAIDDDASAHIIYMYTCTCGVAGVSIITGSIPVATWSTNRAHIYCQYPINLIYVGGTLQIQVALPKRSFLFVKRRYFLFLEKRSFLFSKPYFFFSNYI
jgi:hypothetical protein